MCCFVLILSNTPTDLCFLSAGHIVFLAGQWFFATNRWFRLTCLWFFFLAGQWVLFFGIPDFFNNQKLIFTIYLKYWWNWRIQPCIDFPWYNATMFFIKGWVYGCLRHSQQYFNYIVAISFIGEGNFIT